MKTIKQFLHWLSRPLRFLWHFFVAVRLMVAGVSIGYLASSFINSFASPAGLEWADFVCLGLLFAAVYADLESRGG